MEDHSSKADYLIEYSRSRRLFVVRHNNRCRTTDKIVDDWGEELAALDTEEQALIFIQRVTYKPRYFDNNGKEVKKTQGQ